jgi:pimeloyl-ACP methyl ester carboxylesterase
VIDAACYSNFLRQAPSGGADPQVRSRPPGRLFEAVFRVCPKKTKWYWWPILIRSILLLVPAQLAMAQGGPGVEGNWMGTLDTGSTKLRLFLKVAKTADGSLSAKMDSLDQGAKDMPVSSIAQTGMVLKFEMQRIGGAYVGRLNADGSELSGNWHQSDATLPLVFRRTDKPPALSRPQEPKKPYPYSEVEVTYENKPGGAKLAGTLTLPSGFGPFPAVLLITGSGQQDRDEAIMGHRPFLVLADHLTRKGIAVLRVDDRGVGGSTGEVKTATTEDFAGDVLAGVEFLKNRGKPIDPHKIGLIGHSEGGTIAPMAATRSSDVAFIVMMAGTGVPGDEILMAQVAGLSKAAGVPAAAIAKNLDLERQILDIVKQESDPKAREARLREWKDKSAPQMPDAQVQAVMTPWMRFFVTFDPATALRKVACPVLALNGERDLQVPPDLNLPAIDKALKAGGNHDYQIVKLPKLNHLFQTSQTGAMDEYARIEETIAPGALETMSTWILRHTQ